MTDPADVALTRAYRRLSRFLRLLISCDLLRPLLPKCRAEVGLRHNRLGDPLVKIAVATAEVAGPSEDMGACEINLLIRILVDTEKCRNHFSVFQDFHGARGERVVVPWCHFPTISMDLTWEGSPFSPRMRFA